MTSNIYPYLIISEIAEIEDNYASALEISRQTLKQIRNTESSVHPTRENKIKITDQIAHLKYKDPTSSKIMTLEQELVRAEAENLVAEAQLTNITRQKLKEAYTTTNRCHRRTIRKTSHFG